MGGNELEKSFIRQIQLMFGLKLGVNKAKDIH